MNAVTREFVTAGHAIFTVVSKTGERYTYRVTRKDPDPREARAMAIASYASSRFTPRGPVWFVGLLTGPNNEADYTYLGVLQPESGAVRLTRKSKYTEESKPYRVASWALGRLWAKVALPEGYAIHHEGRCGRCGRLLTVPESITSGFGPECIKLARPVVSRNPAMADTHGREPQADTLDY